MWNRKRDTDELPNKNRLTHTENRLVAAKGPGREKEELGVWG